ncbi:MAG: diacylglycerol kinase family lipid kinase [Bacteroidales bacterium]
MNPTESKWVFVVNPVAGGGAGRTMVPALEQELARRSLDARIALTDSHGHASILATNFLQLGYTHFIAVGGDGTFNEMASPLVGRPGLTLGLIPAGTGNDFIQILGWPDRFGAKEWDLFFEEHVKAMDVGQVNEHFFFNGMGLGFDAQVAAENYVAPDKLAEGKGKSKYLWHIVKTLLFYREKKIRIRTAEMDVRDDCFMHTIANGRRFAGDFFLTPDALADDGLLDVCMIRRLNLLQRFRILPMVPKGTHIRDPRVDTHQTSALNVHFDQEMPFHIDGELLFGRSFEVSVLPGPSG